MSKPELDLPLKKFFKTKFEIHTGGVHPSQTRTLVFYSSSLK